MAANDSANRETLNQAAWQSGAKSERKSPTTNCTVEIGTTGSGKQRELMI